MLQCVTVCTGVIRARVSQPIDSGLYHTTEQQEVGPRPPQRAGPRPPQRSGLDQNHPTITSFLNAVSTLENDVYESQEERTRDINIYI